MLVILTKKGDLVGPVGVEPTTFTRNSVLVALFLRVSPG
jgi:hypothetical protein